MSRTMMLEDLSLVLGIESPDQSKDAYRTAILDLNILGKPTRSTRLHRRIGCLNFTHSIPPAPCFACFATTGASIGVEDRCWPF